MSNVCRAFGNFRNTGYKVFNRYKQEGLEALCARSRRPGAIARAKLLNAPVLVLDEAKSSIDLESETENQAGMSGLARSRTVIVVAQRLWTAVDADKIWVLADGRIVERGTHSLLLANTSGRCRSILDQQARTHNWRIEEPE